MKKAINITMALFLLMAFGFPSGAYAQEWTKEQKEIWQKVEEGWTTWQSGDVEKYIANVHDKFQGWNNEYPLPSDKDKMIKWFSMSKNFMTIQMYDITPARIAVTKNAAVVDYYYTFYATWSWGDKKEEKEIKGRIAEFWTKEEGTWKLLGDMGINDEEEDED